jgi:hypothetical protein
MSPYDVPAPITKASLLRRLMPGTQLTLIESAFGPTCRPRTVHKANSYQLELYADDKPDRPLSSLTFNAGDKFFMCSLGFFVVSSDCVVSYAWGHHDIRPAIPSLPAAAV